MARKNKSKKNGLVDSESNVAPILEISQSEPLFTLAAHPTRPIIATGLGTGHLYCYSYDDKLLQERLDRKRAAFLKSEDSDNSHVSQLKKKWWVHERDHAAIGENSPVKVNWKTKRHKGSCRTVAFDVLENSVGENIYSVGTDHMIKKAATETGKVIAKTDFSSHLSDSKDVVTNMALSTTHPFLLTGTENGNVLVFDTNRLSSPELKFRCDSVHEDAITKILPMPAVSPYHYLSLGSTVLSHIDIRKGIVTQSDDQSDELLSMCYPTEFMHGNKNDTVIVGHGEGIVTLWKNSNNSFMDQISRVKVNKNASIDTVISPMNAGDDNLLDSIWCGDSDGLLHRINYKRGKVVETRAHSLLVSKMGLTDEVSGLDIDYEYRLISSGMESLKIWSLQTEEDLVGSSDSESDSDLDDLDTDSDLGFDKNDSDSDLELDLDSDEEDNAKAEEDVNADHDESNVGNKNGGHKEPNDDSSLDFGSDVDSDDETKEETRAKKSGIAAKFATTKRKKININKITKKDNGQEAEPESKKRKIKQKAKPIQHNGIAKFDGL